MEKTLDNTTTNQAKDQVSDLQIWGDGDTFKLICKASSKAEGWMKSTKAMEIPGVGCVVQVTTQQINDTGVLSYKKDERGDFIKDGNGLLVFDDSNTIKSSVIAEAVTFVPGVCISEALDKQGNVTRRKLVKF